MAETKSQKRLVSKKEFVEWLAGGLIGYAVWGVMASIGIFCMTFAIVMPIIAIVLILAEHQDSMLLLPALLASGLVGALSILLLRFSKQLYSDIRSCESVTPIMRHNTGNLPAETSLVRASTMPTESQQAELLRAAEQGQETPREDLLRATDQSSGEGEGNPV